MGTRWEDDLMVLYDQNVLTDEDFLLLTSKRPRSKSQLVSNGARFNLNTLDDSECISLFRFEKESLTRIEHALRVPQRIVCANNTVASGQEGLCITLRRMAYPNRLADLVPLFGRYEPEISMIFNETVNFLDETHGHLLTNLNQQWLNFSNLEIFSDAIYDKAPLEHCWGFIDGTLRPISRPSMYQELTFSGHKRTHGLKFQSVVVPNGLIANLYGPIEGKRHDAALLRESRILQKLEHNMTDPNGRPFYLYGDNAYPLHSHLLGPFKGACLSSNEEEFNQRMSSVRQCVEWGFSKVTQQFAFLDFKKNLKLYLQPVGRYYRVGCLLTNCQSCIYGSQTSDFFNIDAPTLEHYINNI